MNIKVLGASCCKKCETLYEVILQVLKENNIDANVEKVNNPIEVAQYGIMATPGIVINENVVSYGRMLKKDEVEKLIIK